VSEWADVDHWKATVGAQQNTAFRAFELFAVLQPRGPNQRNPVDRRFAVRDGIIRATQRRNAGMRSRGWRKRGADASRVWLEEHAGETWEGVSISELLVALDAWLEAGSPAVHASRLRRLTPVM